MLCVDLTEDGWPDIYVCNDEEPNQLWVNGGDGTFSDEAMFRGCAVNGDGRVEASMGVALGDVNNDGLLDLFMTHVASETNTLYTLSDQELYFDESTQSGISPIDLPYTGWGCALIDLDHDGDLDMVVANGRVAAGPVVANATLGEYWNRYAEPNLLFLNDGEGHFSDAGDQGGSFTRRSDLARGLAYGDLDGDGDLDLVTNSLDNRLRIYRNDASGARSGESLHVLAITENRVAIGAKITLQTTAGNQVRYVLPSTSYLASNDARVHFGIPKNQAVHQIQISWPDGQRQLLRPQQQRGHLTIEQSPATAN